MTTIFVLCVTVAALSFWIWALYRTGVFRFWNQAPRWEREKFEKRWHRVCHWPDFFACRWPRSGDPIDHAILPPTDVPICKKCGRHFPNEVRNTQGDQP